MMVMSMGECGTVSDAGECDALDQCAWKFDEDRCDRDGRIFMSAIISAGISEAMLRYQESADYDAGYAAMIDATVQAEMHCLLTYSDQNTCSPDETNQRCEWDIDDSSCTSYGTPPGGVEESAIEAWCERYRCFEDDEEQHHEEHDHESQPTCAFGHYMHLLGRLLDGDLTQAEFEINDTTLQCHQVGLEIAERTTCRSGVGR
jgi:hypothetical protein